jgi:hypothetical protein
LSNQVQILAGVERCMDEWGREIYDVIMQ